MALPKTARRSGVGYGRVTALALALALTHVIPRTE